MTDKLLELADDHEKMMADELIAAFRKADSECAGRLRTAIKQGNLPEVLRSISQAGLREDLQQRLDGLVRGILAQAAELASDSLGFEIRFDITNQKAVEYIDRMVFSTALKIEQQVDQAVRDAIRRGFTEGGHPIEIARGLRERIGLTSHQWQAVDNYATFIDSLSEKDAPADATRTAMARLKRGGYRGKNPTTLTFSEQRKQDLVRHYANRLRNDRCKTIARTLVIDVSNTGQNALWQQAEAQGLLQKGIWQVEWIAAIQERTCPVCNGLNGKRREIDGSYLDGTARPPRHLNCRCSEGLVRRSQKAAAL